MNTLYEKRQEIMSDRAAYCAHCDQLVTEPLALKGVKGRKLCPDCRSRVLTSDAPVLARWVELEGFAHDMTMIHVCRADKLETWMPAAEAKRICAEYFPVSRMIVPVPGKALEMVNWLTRAALDRLISDPVSKYREQVKHLSETLRLKNIALDALHVVWCSGGCDRGVHRFLGSPDHVTEEMVAYVERQAVRFREWFTRRQASKRVGFKTCHVDCETRETRVLPVVAPTLQPDLTADVVCSNCGVRCGKRTASEWRWSGSAWEHKCPTLPAQAGHMPAAARSGIYVMSQSKHGNMWLQKRAAGMPIVSTWIDEYVSGATKSWSESCQRFLRETKKARAGLLVILEGDTPKGGCWLETGALLAQGVHVYAYIPGSQIHWEHPLFHRCDSQEMAERMAVAMCSAPHEGLSAGCLAALRGCDDDGCDHTPESPCPHHPDKANRQAVTSDGYTRLPEQMLSELNLIKGGPLWFVRGKDRWEAWLESELATLLGADAPTPAQASGGGVQADEARREDAKK